MKDDYIDERTCIPCKRHSDCYLPDLKASDQEHPPLGKYGMMRRIQEMGNIRNAAEEIVLRDVVYT